MSEKSSGATLQNAKVLSVHHWTEDGLFSFTTERPPGYHFESGQFVMIGLPDENGKPVLRAYSIASPAWDTEHLEFLSIKVQNGPLTSRLQKIKPGDDILVGAKPTGTLVHSALTPGKNLFLMGTGTGLAPWMSIIRDPETYERFERIYVCHGVRETKELAYRDLLEGDIAKDGMLALALIERGFGGDAIHFEDDDINAEGKLTDKAQGRYAEWLKVFLKDRLTYYPTATREAFKNQGRLTDLVENKILFTDLGLDQTKFNPETDRVMVCGSVPMTKEMEAICEAQGLEEGSVHQPGAFVVERAFVEKTVKPTPTEPPTPQTTGHEHNGALNGPQLGTKRSN